MRVYAETVVAERGWGDTGARDEEAIAYPQLCRHTVVVNFHHLLTLSWSRFFSITAACTLLVPALGATAQQPTGRVSGFVYDATTHLPLRFAIVQLVPQTMGPERFTTGSSPDGSTWQKPEPRLRLVGGMSGMDGHFDLEGVPAGDYYASAQMLGYIEPGIAVAKKGNASEEEVKDALDGFPKVHVAVGQVETTNLTLQRGGVIAGRIQFADGSPMIHTGVSAEPVVRPSLPAKADLKPVSPQQDTLMSLTTFQGRSEIVTDDQGNFRIFGLPPGKYMVDTLLGLDHSGAHVIMSNGPVEAKGRQQFYPEMILVFAPGVFRQKDAKVYEIHGEEQITDANLQIDPTGLHTVTGKVLVGKDRHVPNGVLSLQAAGSQPPGRFVTMEEDGSFQFNDLPEDSYILQVKVSDTSEDSTTHMFKTTAYQAINLPVVVGQHDIILDTLSPPPLKPGERDPGLQP